MKTENAGDERIEASASGATILDGLIPEPEFAKQIKKCLRTVQRWRASRQGPPFVMIGRDAYYRIESARAWVVGREQQSGPQLRRRANA